MIKIELENFEKVKTKLESDGFTVTILPKRFDDMDFCQISKGCLTTLMCNNSIHCSAANPQFGIDTVTNDIINKFNKTNVIKHFDEISFKLKLKLMRKINNIYDIKASLDFDDLVLIAYIDDGSNEIVTSKMLEAWDKDFCDITKEAAINMRDYCCLGNPDDNAGIIIASATEGIENAVAFLMTDELYDFCERNNSSLLICPANINEMFIIPISNISDEERKSAEVKDFFAYWKFIVKQGNSFIDEDMVLSDNLYFYNGATKTFEFGDMKYTIDEIQRYI